MSVAAETLPMEAAVERPMAARQIAVRREIIKLLLGGRGSGPVRFY
jgi:hypothetical protein